jgi:hypothetical protein
VRKIKLFFSFISIVICSCHEQKESHDKGELIDYFRTKEIEITNINNNVEIEVKNSQLIQVEKKKKGDKWTTTEAFGSIGALIYSKQANKSVDSIILKIRNVNNIEERYAYRVDDLKKVRKYVDTCDVFSKLVGKGAYSDAKLLMGKDILDKASESQIDNFLKSIFSGKKVVRSELVAFNIKEGIAGLYINVYFDNKELQTFIFAFRIEGDGKISGINIP